MKLWGLVDPNMPFGFLKFHAIWFMHFLSPLILPVAIAVHFINSAFCPAAKFVAFYKKRWWLRTLAPNYLKFWKTKWHVRVK
jgi:hypothetical protein